jgi:hypothetical protein
MKFPIRIAGYAGEHDEAGARIVDANGKLICTTPHIENVNSRESWKEYYDNAQTITDALNIIHAISVERLEKDL